MIQFSYSYELLTIVLIVVKFPTIEAIVERSLVLNSVTVILVNKNRMDKQDLTIHKMVSGH